MTPAEAKARELALAEDALTRYRAEVPDPIPEPLAIDAGGKIDRAALLCGAIENGVLPLRVARLEIPVHPLFMSMLSAARVRFNPDAGRGARMVAAALVRGLAKLADVPPAVTDLVADAVQRRHAERVAAREAAIARVREAETEVKKLRAELDAIEASDAARREAANAARTADTEVGARRRAEKHERNARLAAAAVGDSAENTRAAGTGIKPTATTSKTPTPRPPRA